MGAKGQLQHCFTQKDTNALFYIHHLTSPHKLAYNRHIYYTILKIHALFSTVTTMSAIVYIGVFEAAISTVIFEYLDSTIMHTNYNVRLELTIGLSTKYQLFFTTKDWVRG